MRAAVLLVVLASLAFPRQLYGIGLLLRGPGRESGGGKSRVPPLVFAWANSVGPRFYRLRTVENKKRKLRYHPSMDGERSSTTRQRLSGKICALCRVSLAPPHKPGEQVCPSCQAQRQPNRKVYLGFQRREHWDVWFMQPDLKTSLPTRLTFEREDKIRRLAERGGAFVNLEAKSMLDHGLEIGRGGVWLNLTEEQYQRLLRP